MTRRRQPKPKKKRTPKPAAKPKDAPVEGFAPTRKMEDALTVFLETWPLFQTQKALCEAAGVDPSTWRRWWKRPGFQQWWNTAVFAAMKNQRGEVWRALTEKAKKGESSAITLWLKRFDLIERPPVDAGAADFQRILDAYGIRYNDAGADADAPGHAANAAGDADTNEGESA